MRVISKSDDSKKDFKGLMSFEKNSNHVNLIVSQIAGFGQTFQCVEFSVQTTRQNSLILA